MRIAIDLDNTIVAYDHLFGLVARARRLVEPEFVGTKLAVRESVRSSAGGDTAWQILQADVYGRLIAQAPPFAGAQNFVRRARARGVAVAIVSHKTEFAAAGSAGINLRDAARNWLYAHEFIGPDLVRGTDVFFESSRAEKLERIRALEVNIVIDDLIEVLIDSAFPAMARRWLFDPADAARGASGVERFTDWESMSDALDG